MPINAGQLTTDFKQKYEHTYIRVRFPDTQKKKVFYVDTITSGIISPHLILSNPDSGQIQLNYDTESDIFFDMPPVGYSLYDGKQAILFKKLSNRQWKRGVCIGNSTLFSPYNAWFSNPVGINTPCLESAYAGKLVSFQEAVSLIYAKKALSVPFSKTLCLGLSPTLSELPLIWFYDTPIAELHSEGTVVRLHEKHFEQELLDTFQKERVNVHIV